jgi:hypothetical protein
LSHSTSSFLWWVFWDIVLQTICPGWLQTAILLRSYDYGCEPSVVWLILKREVLQIICLGWPQTMILLISASQVGKIIGWVIGARLKW